MEPTYHDIQMVERDSNQLDVRLGNDIQSPESDTALTQTPNHIPDESLKSETVSILLVGPVMYQLGFQNSLGKVPELEILTARRFGTQTELDVSVTTSQNALIFLRTTLENLPGYSVRVQGVTIAPKPTIVCAAIAVSQKSRSRRLGIIRRSNTAPAQPLQRVERQHVESQPAVVNTEAQGIQHPSSLDPVAAPPNGEEAFNESGSAAQVMLNTFTSLLFIFGDVELGFAMTRRKPSSERAINLPSFRKLVRSTIKSALIGTAFVFGDTEVGIRNLRHFITNFSFRRIRDTTYVFGAMALIISVIFESILGTNDSDQESAETNPKS
ncbi:hypothetical protein JYU04_03410 [Dehalococcoides mccartyi]|nr:hypothetical protein [Dehalococcoides mccartyi]